MVKGIVLAWLLPLVIGLLACGGSQTLDDTVGPGLDSAAEGASDATASDAIVGQDAMAEGALDASPDASADASAEGAILPDSGACGDPGLACCPAETCHIGGCCVDQKCISNGQSCGGALATCSNGSCGSCGGAGQPCCPMMLSEDCSGPTATSCGGCTAPGTGCPGGSTTAMCIACGADDHACCPAGICQDPLSYCLAYLPDSSNTYAYTCTTKCGHDGEPCCQNNVCTGGGCCMQGLNGAQCTAASTCGCTNGACTTCGVMGSPCCSGALCGINQGACSSGTCSALHP